jgi:hypothetical protein
MNLLGGMLVFASLLAGPPASIQAAESPFVGNWKVSLLFPGQTVHLLIVQIKVADGKPTAEVIASGIPDLKDLKVESVRVLEDKSLLLDVQGSGLTFAFTAYPIKGDDKQLLGSVLFRGQYQFAQLERTDEKQLDPEKSQKPDPRFQDFIKAMRQQDAKEKQTALKEFLTKESSVALAYTARIEMLGTMVGEASVDEAKAEAEQIVKLAAPYGPEMKLRANLDVARALASSDKLAALALDHARQAEKLIGAATPASVQVAVLKGLASALRKAGKADEVKEVTTRITKLDEVLDQEFIKNAVPFKPEPFAARKGKSNRVVLVELFTGAQCPPCVAADVAFDGLLQSFQAKDVAFLQYHLHIPGPDALTNSDSEKRSEFYQIQGTPTFFIDGKEGPPSGGGKEDGKNSYDGLVKVIASQLEVEPKANLKLTASSKGEEIGIHAEVTDMQKPGENVRLHLVLVEEVVRYAGSNGQRLHHHVVRAFPGGVEGMALKENTAKQAVTVNVADLRKSLADYLQDFNDKKRPFSNEDRPLDLKNLKVVAFIQDNKSKEILQTAQAELGEAK